ncbi:MAG: toprim domain-containing protein, partial [Pseudomonas paracarnis]
MAIKSEFGDDGFEIWDQWSSLSSSYRAIDARDVWKSVKAGKGITIASLFYDAKQAGWKDDTAYKKPSAAEIEQRRKERAERDALAAQQELAAQEAAAVKAQELWAAATPCESHAYLERKGVKSHGLRYGRFEITRIDPNTGEVTVVSLHALLMPIMDRSRKIWTLQAFSAKPDGRKSLLKNGRKSGNFFVIGSKPLMTDDRPVFILVEGYATGASVHEATGHMVMVCVDAGNLRNVARSIRERSPNAILVVAADNDTQTEGNPGLAEANKAAKESGCLVAYPPDGGDFNDLAAEHGHTAVADVIQLALVSATSPAPEPEAEPQQDAEP